MNILYSNCPLLLVTHGVADGEEPYPSLSDYHDYEPNLEFDDTELHQPPDANTGKFIMCMWAYTDTTET